MRRRWLIGMVVCAQYVHTVYAQTWSKEDSIRLANILSGRDTLRLNPEFQRSIQNGTFINLNPVGKMKSASSKVPFTKDFSEYIKLDKSVLVEGKKSWKDMPPQAAMREPIEVKEPDLKVIRWYIRFPDKSSRRPLNLPGMISMIFFPIC